MAPMTLDLSDHKLLGANQARAKAIFATALMDKGQQAEAIAIARQLLSDPHIDQRAALWAKTLLVKSIPRWHRGMMRDQARNDAYDAALRRAVTADDVVLEIGAGSGLLAMMAARAGAGAVVACEMHPVVAALAADIIDANGYADRVRIVNHHSRDIAPGADLPQPADILVSELFAANLLGEGVLETHKDAMSRLMRPGARVIPGRAAVMVALGYDEHVESHAVQMVSGFDVGLFNAAIPVDRLVGGNRTQHLRIRSTPVPLFEFNLAEPDKWPAPVTSVEVEVTASPVNVLLQWIRLTLDESGLPGSVYENRPGVDASHHWGTWVHTLHAPPLESGRQTARIGGYWAGSRLEFWLE